MPTHSHIQTGSPAAQPAPRRILIARSAATIIAARRARADVLPASVLARASLCATRMQPSHARRLPRLHRHRHLRPRPHRPHRHRPRRLLQCTATLRRRDYAQTRAIGPLTLNATTADSEPSGLPAVSVQTALTVAPAPRDPPSYAQTPATMRRMAGATMEDPERISPSAASAPTAWTAVLGNWPIAQ